MRGNARSAAGALLVGLWLWGGAASAAAPEMAPWVASESWPGGRQHDARLERTVQFWGAGIPLREVFAGIREQTGVEIGFWPAGDVNQRVCVNLYLNPERPPTLRQVMAQLSWATDCSFGYWVEGDEARYWLLRTSIGDRMPERLREGRSEARERDYRRAQQAMARLPARGEALREALSLPREAAIRRYRGKDDLLLLAALDPTQRATAELYLTLPMDRAWDPLSVLLSQKLSELSAEQQRHVREAMREPLERLLERERSLGATYDTGPDAVAWFESFDPTVTVSIEAGPDEAATEVMVYGSGPGGYVELDLPSLQLAGTMSPEGRLDLRQALGERLSQDERDRFTEEYWRERELAERRRFMEEQLGRVRLSAEREGLLSSLDVPARLDGRYALWEIQEMAARASGLHVVSDCLWQPVRSLSGFAEVLYPGEKPRVTALVALRLATLSGHERGWLDRFVGAVPSSVGWEWREAGDLLVFRSTGRDVWRGAFLPEDALEAVDRWVEPHLEGMADTPAGVGVVEVEPDWRSFGRLILRLDFVQRKWGGFLTYGDPEDERHAWRQAFRERVMQIAWDQPWVLRFLGSLSDGQWEQLQGEGLRVGVDMSVGDMAERWRWLDGEKMPHAVALSSDLWRERPGGWVRFQEGDVVRVRRVERTGTWAAEMWEIEVVRGERVVETFVLPVRIAVGLGGAGRAAGEEGDG